MKFTAIGVYLESNAVECLAAKWKGKTAEELTESVQFFREIVTGNQIIYLQLLTHLKTLTLCINGTFIYIGPFEKFTRITMILPLTGQQYSEKVSENCVAIWKSLGIYTEAEGKAIEKFLEAFKDQNFAPGSSVLFTQSLNGSLAVCLKHIPSAFFLSCQPSINQGKIIQNKN